MRSGSQFESTEQITRTQMVALLQDAKNSVFTCTFRKQTKDKDIEDVLKSIKTDSELHNNHLAKQLLAGELLTLTCFLTKTEASLGRSLVIDLNQPYGKGFRQIDHRTVEELIIKNVKYTLKK